MDLRGREFFFLMHHVAAHHLLYRYIYVYSTPSTGELFEWWLRLYYYITITHVIGTVFIIISVKLTTVYVYTYFTIVIIIITIIILYTTCLYI